MCVASEDHGIFRHRRVLAPKQRESATISHRFSLHGLVTLSGDQSLRLSWGKVKWNSLPVA